LQENMKIINMSIDNPKSYNLIIGQSHFIKTVEDIHEMLVGSVPNIKFGLAFAEASGSRLIRTSGTSDKMIELASKNVEKLGCGHVFIIFLENAFPINILNALKNIPEVVNIFCATANPLEVIIGKSGQGAGILGVIDGSSPQDIEKKTDVIIRKNFLRKIGYKL